MSQIEQVNRYMLARRQKAQRNRDRILAQQKQIETHSYTPYGSNQTMMTYPSSGPVGRVTVGMDTRLSNQATLGNGLLSNKMLGVDSQGESDGCCPNSGPCPNVNPISGPTCTNSCQITKNQNNVERSYIQNNNILLNFPGLMNN